MYALTIYFTFRERAEVQAYDYGVNPVFRALNEQQIEILRRDGH